MPKYLIKISVGTIEDSNIKQAIQEGTEWLAGMVHAYLIEKANSEFKSRRKDFVSALRIIKVEDGTWGVALDDKANWIIEGSSPFNMLDGLLSSSKAKHGKNGRYIIVPFKHSGDNLTPMQAVLATAVKAEMTKRHIGTEDADESSTQESYPWLLSSFDIEYPSTKKEAYDQLTDEERPPWSVNMKQDHPTVPLLKNVRVYSHSGLSGDSEPKGRAYTFRTAAESQRNTGKWDHPGTPPSQIWEDAQEWAQDKWDNTILPGLLDDLAQGW
jgi:hypothetical protein